jgi:hypothetical protein
MKQLTASGGGPHENIPQLKQVRSGEGKFWATSVIFNLTTKEKVLQTHPPIMKAIRFFQTNYPKKTIDQQANIHPFGHPGLEPVQVCHYSILHTSLSIGT